MFDFTNYTYSTLVTFIAMVIGMAYPSLLQAIQRIDETYHDDLMIRRFKEESTYKHFNEVLILAVGGGFILPFLLYMMDRMNMVIVSSALLCVQAVVTFILIVQSIRLCGLIITYYNTTDLLRHLENNGSSALPQRLKIMLRAAESGNEDTYRLSLESIYEQIVRYQAQFYDRTENKNKPIDYPNDYYGIFREIVKATTQKERYGFLADDNQLAAILYNNTLPIIVSGETLKYLWYAVNRITEADCHEWFRQYWTYAEQYYRFTLDNSHQDMQGESFIRIRHQYLFMHFMMGGLMLYEKKYDWLKLMLTFTQTMPWSYPLVPGSFPEIWDMLREAYMKESLPWGLANDFLFVGLTTDVSVDAQIYKNAERYAALLLMRLHSLPEFRVNDNKYQIPEVANGIHANEQIMLICENLKVDILELAEDNEIKNCFNYGIEDSIRLVDELKDKAENTNEQIRKEPQVSTDKLSDLKNEIIEKSGKMTQLSLPPVKEDEKSTAEVKLIKGVTEISDELICSGFDLHCIGFAECVVGMINHRIYSWYESRFALVPPIKSYQIQYQSIFKALDALKLDESCAILLFGIYLGKYSSIYGDVAGIEEIDGSVVKYNNVSVYSVNSSSAESIVVMRVKEMPCVSFCSVETSDGTLEGLNCLDKELGIYSNIETLSAKQHKLAVGRLIQSSNMDTALKYVSLKISHEPTTGEDDLDNIKSIAKYLPYNSDL